MNVASYQCTYFSQLSKVNVMTRFVNCNLLPGDDKLLDNDVLEWPF